MDALLTRGPFLCRVALSDLHFRNLPPRLPKPSKMPQGVGVVIEAEHSCMTLRGVNALGSTLITSRLLGVLRDDPRTREEFLALFNFRLSFERRTFCPN
jgi:hypothetical protein